MWCKSKDYRFEELEYLENGDGQYIDTGVYPTHQHNVDCEFTYLYISDRYCFLYSASQTYSVRAFETFFDGSILRVCKGNSVRTLTVNQNQIHSVKINSAGQTKKIVSVGIDDNADTFDLNVIDFMAPSTMTIFAINRPSGMMFEGACRCHYFRLNASGEAVRDLVPCRRIIDGELGMYDKVSGDFLTNQGTGSFIPGPPTGNYY